MNLAREISSELLKNGDIEQLKRDLSGEINYKSLNTWFHMKLAERDFESANQVLGHMVGLGFDCEELSVRLFLAEQEWARRVV